MTPDPLERFRERHAEPPRPLRPLYAAEVESRLEGLEGASRAMVEAFNGNAELLAILMQRIDHLTRALEAAGVHVPVPICSHPEDGVRAFAGALYCSTCGALLRRADGTTPG